MSPDKPTRDSATDAEDPRSMYGTHAGRESAKAAPGDSREEKGTASSSHRDRPHATEGTEDVKGEDAPGEVPVMPANAQGTDRVSTEEHDQPIDDTSMYDGRRDEDKETPPSTR